MAGLYDGLEEVAFKRTEGGYVFQTNNRFLIGPRRRFLVNEAQKADIAACMRETLRRIKPFVFLMMAALPAAIVGLIYWFVVTSATLTRHRRRQRRQDRDPRASHRPARRDRHARRR